MQGEIDTSFTTNQRDLFTSGMAAHIGMNAFGVWVAIKSHADFNDGEAWPGIRRLAEMTGLGKATIGRAIETLIDAKLLRVVETGKGHKTSRYLARERLDVKLGGRVLCTIVVDYVPAVLREKLDRIKSALQEGKPITKQEFAEVDIIPGPGFAWNEKEGMLKAAIPAADLPARVVDAGEAKLLTDLQKKAQAMRGKALPKGGK